MWVDVIEPRGAQIAAKGSDGKEKNNGGVARRVDTSGIRDSHSDMNSDMIEFVSSVIHCILCEVLRIDLLVMATLRSVPELNDNISRAPKNAIVALHRFVFAEDGDRGNRSHLRKFTSFKFAERSEVYSAKIQWAVEEFSLADLITICNVLRIDYTDTTLELASRICRYLTNLQLLCRERRDGDSVETDEESSVNVTMPTFTMSFQDIEDTIPKFDGGDSYPIEVWISDFEDSATLSGWTKLQKLLFAKKSLTGLTKLFIRGERGINSWKKLKSLLLQEFAVKITSAELHRTLIRRKMKREESVQEYFLAVKEIAARGSIETDDNTLIQYVVDGIPEESSKKISLYEACTLVELKTKLEVYQKVKQRSQAQNFGNSQNRASDKTPSRSGSRGIIVPSKETKGEECCYNCNERGHSTSACPKPKRDRGTYYTCGSADHQRRSCPQRASVKQQPTTAASNPATHLVQPQRKMIPSYNVSVNLDIGEINAVLDTGSPLSLLNNNVIPNQIQLEPYIDTLQFEGVNKSRIKILGCLKRKISVQEREVSINFYVVPDSAMSYAFDLSNPVSIRKKIEVETANFISEIMQIDVSDGCLIDEHYVQPRRPEFSVTNLEMELVLKSNHQPFFYRQKRLSYSEKEAVTKIIHDLLDRRIIQPSLSQYCSPIVLIKKKTGQYRMAVDYRDLNKLTLRDNFPIPRINDQIDHLRNKVYFTRLDLKDAFHHIKLKENSIPYTAFVTFMGQFEYFRMPFGLANGPSFVMRFVNTPFQKLLREQKILIYLDDILIATETVEENLEILEEVLSILINNCLELKMEKCVFLLTEIVYLGYNINSAGIKPSADNIQLVTDFPIPRNYRELQSFLGLVSYFRKFIKNFALIAKPLYDLLKSKSDYKWDQEVSLCFETLKKLLISEPVLSIMYVLFLYTPRHRHRRVTSGYAPNLKRTPRIGENMREDARTFDRRKTKGRTRGARGQSYASQRTIHETVFGLTAALERIFADRIRILIVLFCRVLVPINRYKQFYSYTIYSHSAETELHCDASTHGRNHNILVIAENAFERNLTILQDLDPEICNIREKLEQNEDKFYELNNGLVGHQGISKTIEYLTRVYWFPKMKEKVHKYILNCLKCITYATTSNRVESKLHCPSVGNLPFKCLHIDHYGPLEKLSHRQKYLFEVIDSLTKFVKLYPTTSTNSDEVIQHLRTYFSMYSKPTKIVSNCEDIVIYYGETPSLPTDECQSRRHVINRLINPNKEYRCFDIYTCACQHRPRNRFHMSKI
ncbi:uncharacterized protein LOC143180500 [Calliopsis andreniformis]|uniref:uncharacterized protein LOC143180500 n=1 Tax=Calliopsis andreniformis TaxID=337506 RepID=UPI003FCC57E4